MRATPEIPDRFRSFTHSGYTNAFALVPGCERFYCTETMLGDWDAETLILAKDAAPTHAIRDRARREGNSAWRHGQRALGDKGGWRTNTRIETLASGLPGTQLYGSAAANMLCDDPRWSRDLPGFRNGPLHDYLVDALHWVIDNMPNLQAVACIGEHAWFLAAIALNQPDACRRSRQYRDAERALTTSHRGRALTLTAHFHPARGSRQQWRMGWDALANRLNASADRRQSPRANAA